MLIFSSCVRELPCDLLLSSTVLQKKERKKKTQFLGLKRSENRLAVSGKRHLPGQRPIRPGSARGQGVKREDHHRLLERKKITVKFCLFWCFLHLNL